MPATKPFAVPVCDECHRNEHFRDARIATFMRTDRGMTTRGVTSKMLICDALGPTRLHRDAAPWTLR
jgi:hypothetical protein